MKRSSNRIAKLETQVARRWKTEYRGNRALDVRLACAMLACEPGLALVAACDTDAETYREIEETRAFARRDYQSAERLAAARPKCQPLPAGASREETRRIYAAALDVSDVAERHEQAILAARARLGITADRRRSAPLAE